MPSANFSGNNKYYITLTYSEDSYNISGNTSVVSYKLEMGTVNQSYVGYTNYGTQVSITAELPNGTTTTLYTYNANRDFNPSAESSHVETLKTGTFTVTHKNDGSGAVKFNASVSVAAGPYSPGSASLSNQTLTLYTIPRASTAALSASDVFTIGTSKSVAITRADASFQHKITFTVGNTSVTLPTSGYAATSVSFNPSATTWEGEFPTQTSRVGTAVLKTYDSGGNLLGSNSYSFTMAVPSSWVPGLSVTLSQVGSGYMSGKTFYVAGFSSIQAAMTGSTSHGAAIKSYTITGAMTKTITTSSLNPPAQTSGVIATAGSKTVTVTVMDARGRSTTVSQSVTYLSYSAPSVSALSYARGTYSGGVWTDSDDGADLKISFTAKCSLSGSPANNELSSWNIGAPVSANGSNLANNGTITRYKNSIGTTTAYSVQVTLTDKFGTTVARNITVPTVEIPFVLDVTKPALGVGAVPQTARHLQLANDWFLTAGGGIQLPQTTDALATALAQAAGYIKAWRGTGNSYTGSIPDSSFQTGVFLISTAYANARYVLAIPSNASQGLALNVHNGSTWSGWKMIGFDRYVDKVQAVTFTAGTIGSRAQSYSWSQADIGGAPKLMQIINSTGLASFMPICTIASTNAYLNIYRSVSTAYSSGSITVRIWY